MLGACWVVDLTASSLLVTEVNDLETAKDTLREVLLRARSRCRTRQSGQVHFGCAVMLKQRLASLPRYLEIASRVTSDVLARPW